MLAFDTPVAQYRGAIDTTYTLGGTLGHKDGPFWLYEGVANYLSSFMYHKYRYGTPEITKRDIENRGIPDCFQRGFPNIYEMKKTNSRRCGYRFGEYLFISLSETVGTETVVSALRDLYILGRAENRPVNEEEIYRALLAHTPPGLEDDLQEIYDRIHGGPRADSGE